MKKLFTPVNTLFKAKFLNSDGWEFKMDLVYALIGIMVAVIVGVSVTIPTIATAITDANLTGTTATIVNLLPLMIAIVLLVAIVGYIGFRA